MMSNCSNCGASISADSRFCPDCGQQVSVPATDDNSGQTMMTMGGLETLADRPTNVGSGSEFTPLEPGTVFADRYTIEEVVGRGGMGVVYRATDKLSEKTVALKLIRPNRLVGTNAIKKLIAEGITARDIRHPNIVAVYDVGESDGQPFVSMEYLGGKSLRAWHRQKVQDREDVSLIVACRIIAETLKGLSAAHAAGVVHRDLKPENIVIMGEPTSEKVSLKILDFGIARATGGSQDSGTGTGTGLGTPRYMAPEQITNAESAGPAADFYSVSVMFYELLVDVLPQGHWQPPSGGRSDVPAEIDALIERGLSNRPANRPQSSKEYLDALEVAFARSGGTVDLGQISQLTKKLPIQKILKWSGIAAGAFLLIGLIGMMIPEDGPENDPCMGLYGEALANCLGIPWDGGEEEGEPISRFANLSGNWNDGLGTTYSMRVQDNGRFSGTGRSRDGFSLRLSGSFSGNNATYTVQANEIGLSFDGRMAWDGNCHINFQTFDQSGQSIIEQGQMHVNHSPGAPCPS